MEYIRSHTTRHSSSPRNKQEHTSHVHCTAATCTPTSTCVKNMVTDTQCQSHLPRRGRGFPRTVAEATIVALGPGDFFSPRCRRWCWCCLPSLRLSLPSAFVRPPWKAKLSAGVSSSSRSFCFRSFCFRIVKPQHETAGKGRAFARWEMRVLVSIHARSSRKQASTRQKIQYKS